jgi:hypothetical protein
VIGVVETVEDAMKTRIATFLGSGVLTAALAVGLTIVSAGAHHDDANNYFVLHPGPVLGRTDVDPHDPYAPVAIGTADAGSMRLVGAAVPRTASDDAAADSCSPQRCTAW